MAGMSDRATAKSGFFTLPPELRTAILTAAFGGRTVHIKKCWPPGPPPQRRESRSRAALTRTKKWLGGVFTDKSKEKKETKPAGRHKQSSGFVCCRQPEDCPARDTCISQLDWRYRGTPPNVRVEAIGWLQSCRRAAVGGLARADSDAASYDEGVRVLYGSNTFHVAISSWRVAGRLLPQIPTHILSNVASVELIMTWPCISYQDFIALPESDKSETDMLQRTLSSVPRLMPSLRKLYIGFHGDTCLMDRCDRGNFLAYECTKFITGPMEDMAREFGQMGRSCELELGLPSTPFESHHFHAGRLGHRIATPGWEPGFPSRYSYYPRLRVFQPARSRGLDPESVTGERGGPDIGFWISMSLVDRW